jgi:hypothetical protein
MDFVAGESDRPIAFTCTTTMALRTSISSRSLARAPADRLARILAHSAYAGPVNIETMMHQTGLTDECEFLARTYAAAVRLDGLIRRPASLSPTAT